MGGRLSLNESPAITQHTEEGTYMVPAALLAAYVQIVKAEPDAQAAMQHLAAFLEDVRQISVAVQAAIDAAKARAGQQ